MRFATACILALIATSSLSQDLSYAKRAVSVLCSDSLSGRGYVNEGGRKAAQYIADEFARFGLEPLTGHSYFQHFTHSVNTFPLELEVQVDDKVLIPGVDFQVKPRSSGCSRSEFRIVRLKPKNVKNWRKFKKWRKKKRVGSDVCVVIESAVFLEIKDPKIGSWITNNTFGAGCHAYLTDKLTWSVSAAAGSFPMLEIKSSAISDESTRIVLEIDQQLVSFKNQNVLGMIEGDNKDSFVFVTAHYDHLGMMGTKAMFKGANDNASGTAMMLDLAKHFRNPEITPKFNLVFVAFGAEEAGLVGSKYYTENAIIPLKKIALLINLDLTSTGEKGIMVVNGRIYKSLVRKMDAINETHNLVSAIKRRPKAANSDHYWFSEKGVKAVFIYLLGDYPYYHDVNDTPEKPTWKGYEGTFKLIAHLLTDKL